MTRVLALFLVTLSLSGVASIVNQVAWQRALKVFFGGSEALSSMTVVFVFLLGLGAGSWALAHESQRVKNPLRALGLVELGLFAVNVLIAILLSLDLSETVYGAQRAAIGLGVPHRAVYVAGAILVLTVPCLLMGATLPLASEAAQRHLRETGPRLVGVLFAVNTAGAVLGAIVCGFWLLPRFGQTPALLAAAAMNAIAGLALVAMGARLAAAEPPPLEAAPASPWRSRLAILRPSKEDLLGFSMGILSLAYEMLLLRVLSLTHEPVPYTFATVLWSFLAAWALGVALSSRPSPPVSTSGAIGLAAIGVALLPVYAETVRWWVAISREVATLIAVVPVIGFGLAYGGLVTHNAQRWGRDVGRFAAWNTAGSCLGVLVGTLVGYEMAPSYFGYTLAAGLAAAWVFSTERLPLAARPIAIAALAAVFVYGWHQPPPLSARNVSASFGRDGVIEIDRKGNLLWDGMWHSRLSDGSSHIGSLNWLLAVAPLLVHEGPVEDALVIGVGGGITTGTLARASDVKRVVAYDLNRELTSLLAAYPRGTLGIASNERVHIRWMDGRSGLALHDDRYDLITQQPLYLKQAGASLLLSREYFELVKRRLKPGGIFAIYSNARGNEAQAHLVRETAAAVFPHVLTFKKGYMVLASESPMAPSEASFRKRMEVGDRVAREMAAYDEAAVKHGGERLIQMVDATATWQGGGYLITDDHPLVEYPGWAKRLVKTPEPSEPPSR